MGKPSAVGQGYCTEAACEAIRHAFDDLDLNRVEAHHMTNNPASGRVMRKLGMLPEGILRQAVYKSGEFEDVALYAILRDDY